VVPDRSGGLAVAGDEYPEPADARMGLVDKSMAGDATNLLIAD
jgi:hypothetical protein